MNYLLLYLIVGLPVSVMCALVATATDTPPVKRVVVGLLFWSVWPIFPVVLIREKLMLRHIRTVCAWCSEVVGEYEKDDKTKWRAHLLECPKHPLREQITALRERNAELELRIDADMPPHTIDPRVSELQARVDELEGTLTRLTPDPGTVFVPMPDPWGEDDEIYNDL